MFKIPNWKIFLYGLLYFVEMNYYVWLLFYRPQINHEVALWFSFAHTTTEHYYIIRGLSFCCEGLEWISPKCELESV